MAVLITTQAMTDAIAYVAASRDMQRLKALDLRLWPDAGNLSDIRYALAWKAPHGVLAKLPNLQMIVSAAAGIDHLIADPNLPDVPIVRYVDPDMTARMTAYITLQVLYHYRRMCELRDQQAARIWRHLPEPAPSEVRVGIMGLGALGGAAIAALGPLGFQRRGWSRTPRRIEGVKTFAGLGELDAFLAETDILVAILPSTPDTRHFVNRDLLRKLSLSGRPERLPGPVFINAGRGALQVEGDILAALDAGELYAASLDVFETEPLPPDNPIWSHPRIVLTPHNAAESNPHAIVRYLIRQIAAHERGDALENLVERARGY